MCLLPQDERHLSSALDLARESAAFASPNPAVGCVLARGQTVLGAGAHHYDARDHAEIAALGQAAVRGQNVRGSTAYVTLEPCSHHGRTGPCADALVAAGVTRCVIATVDPNPQVRGRGIAKLRAAGVQVCIEDPSSVLARGARRLNDAFAFSIRHGRPFVTLKAALSVDGKLAPPPSERSRAAPHWLTGEAARADVQTLRHGCDVILTGIGTVLADNPSLTDRTGLPRRRPLLRVVLDGQLRTPLDSRIVRSASGDVLLVSSASAPDASAQALTDRGVEVVRLPAHPHGVELAAVLASLQTRGLRSVLVEAGSRLNGSLLNRDLADRVLLYFSETELGVNAVPFAHDYPSPYILQQQLQQSDRVIFPHGPAADVRISGYLHDPWAGVEMPPV